MDEESHHTKHSCVNDKDRRHCWLGGIAHFLLRNTISAPLRLLERECSTHPPSNPESVGASGLLGAGYSEGPDPLCRPLVSNVPAEGRIESRRTCGSSSPVLGALLFT